jgi:large subunit ribosomal protein L10
MVADELRERFDGVSSACVVDVTGMTVQEQETLRGRLRSGSARLQVVKNSMARRAFQAGPLAPLGEALTGPCALVTSAESPISAAKILVEAAAALPALTLKEAMFDGDAVLMTVVELSKMRDKGDLLGEVAMLVASPGRAIAGCLRSPQSKIAGCLKARIDAAA